MPSLLVGGLTAFYGILVVRTQPTDGDLFWQRWLGERILRQHAIPRAIGPEAFAANGAPWTPHEWLLSIGVALADGHGLHWALGAVAALCVGWCMATVAMRSRRRGASPITCSVAVLACAGALGASFGIRAQVFGWAGVATILWLLESEAPSDWLSVPVTMVWANLHASAIISPFVAGAFAAVAAFEDRRWSPRVARSIAISMCCGLAVLATPFGIGLPRYAFELSGSPIRTSITEWQPTSIAVPGFLTIALPLILLIVAFGLKSLRDRAIAAGFLVALFLASRNVPLFAIAVAPIAASSIPQRRPVVDSQRPAVFTAAITIIAISVMIFAAWRHSDTGPKLPYGPVDVLAHDQARSRIFCEYFQWCSMFLGDAGAGVFIDGRADPYPRRLWQDYADVIDARPQWSAVLDSYRVTAVLARRGSPLDGLLAAAKPLWRVLAFDPNVRIYVRNR